MRRSRRRSPSELAVTVTSCRGQVTCPGARVCVFAPRPLRPRPVRAPPSSPVSDTRTEKFGRVCHSAARRVRGGTKITEVSTRVIGVSAALSTAHLTAKLPTGGRVLQRMPIVMRSHAMARSASLRSPDEKSRWHSGLGIRRDRAASSGKAGRCCPIARPILRPQSG